MSTTDLPLDVSVSSTTNDDHVTYDVKTTIRANENTYEVSHRYSEFLEFRTNVANTWTCQDPNCAGTCNAIREYLASNFPGKGMSMLKMSPRTVSNREQKLCDVLVYLLKCVFLPGNTMQCFRAQSHLTKYLIAFLGVTDEDDERALIQVALDNYRASMASSTNDTTPCTICLKDVELGVDRPAAGSAQSPIRLPCGHTFHRTCIVEWLLFHHHCPRCHQHPQSKARVHGAPVSKAVNHHHPHSKAAIQGVAVSHVTRHHHPQSKARAEGNPAGHVACHLHSQAKARLDGNANGHATCRLRHEERARAHGQEITEVACALEQTSM